MPRLLDYHRVGCQSKNHAHCQEGPLWVCLRCGTQVCPNDGCADTYPDLCDSCWYAVVRKGEAP